MTNTRTISIAVRPSWIVAASKEQRAQLLDAQQTAEYRRLAARTRRELPSLSGDEPRWWLTSLVLLELLDDNVYGLGGLNFTRFAQFWLERHRSDVAVLTVLQRARQLVEPEHVELVDRVAAALGLPADWIELAPDADLAKLFDACQIITAEAFLRENFPRTYMAIIRQRTIRNAATGPQPNGRREPPPLRLLQAVASPIMAIAPPRPTDPSQPFVAGPFGARMRKVILRAA